MYHIAGAFYAIYEQIYYSFPSTRVTDIVNTNPTLNYLRKTPSGTNLQYRRVLYYQYQYTTTAAAIMPSTRTHNSWIAFIKM